MLMRALAVLLLTAAAAFAADPIPVSVQQLLDKPRRYENKLVAVRGYFDASDCLLSARRDPDMAIVLNFTKAQGEKLKTDGKLRSGFVQVVGVFEYVDTTRYFVRHLGGPDDGDLYEGRAGFGGGGFPSQITKIKEFAHVR
jgi:hypothetical protein